jgi:hypothetical protein
VTLRAWIAGIVDPPAQVLATVGYLRPLVAQVEKKAGPLSFDVAARLA